MHYDTYLASFSLNENNFHVTCNDNIFRVISNIEDDTSNTQTGLQWLQRCIPLQIMLLQSKKVAIRQWNFILTHTYTRIWYTHIHVYHFFSIKNYSVAFQSNCCNQCIALHYIAISQNCNQLQLCAQSSSCCIHHVTLWQWWCLHRDEAFQWEIINERNLH